MITACLTIYQCFSVVEITNNGIIGFNARLWLIAFYLSRLIIVVGDSVGKSITRASLGRRKQFADGTLGTIVRTYELREESY